MVETATMQAPVMPAPAQVATGLGYDPGSVAPDLEAAHLRALVGAAAPVLAPDPHPEIRLELAPTVDPSGAWWSPGTALMLVWVTLAWQFTGHYAREILPSKRASGAELIRFDDILGSVPLLSTSAGQFVGYALFVGTVALIWVGIRKGARDPVLQGVVAVLAVVALVAPLVLPGAATS